MNVLVLVLRVALGLMFVVAGALKIGLHFDNFNNFAAEIAGFQILPQPFVAPLALLLPFVEIILGAYLVLGLFTRLVGVVATLQLLIFAAAVASAVVRGISTNCGCFGPADGSTTSWPEVARDVALALVAALVSWRGPGALSLDRRMESHHE